MTCLDPECSSVVSNYDRDHYRDRTVTTVDVIFKFELMQFYLKAVGVLF